MGKHSNHRRGGRQGWGESDDGDFQEPSFFQRRQEEPSDEAVDAEALWFNAAKGYGFVQASQGKAFLHIKQLEAAGHTGLAEGSALKVVLQETPKGLTVTKVVEVRVAPGSAGRQSSPEREARPDQDVAGEVEGTVRWYNAEKGFGFIERVGDGKDIFIHASTLGRAGLASLEEGQAVRVGYGEGKKGPEARSIELI